MYQPNTDVKQTSQLSTADAGVGAGPWQGGVVVLGASGLLGHVMVDRLVAHGAPVTAVMRSTMTEVMWWPTFELLRGVGGIVDGIDVRAWESVERVLEDRRPTAIVNCAGVTPRRDQIVDPAATVQVNSVFPQQLAAWASRHDARLVSVSTDCVFGHEPGGFTEADPPSAVDLYGRSKALGEVTGSGVVTLRTSFVGRELRHRTELLEWFLAQRGGRVSGFVNVWYSGVSVGHVADVIVDLVTTHAHIDGLFHLANEQPISKYDLLRLAGAAFDADVCIDRHEAEVSHRTLDGSALARLLPRRVPSWESMLAALAADGRYALAGAADRVDP